MTRLYPSRRVAARERTAGVYDVPRVRLCVRLCAGRARGRPEARYFHSILLAPARSAVRSLLLFSRAQRSSRFSAER